MKKDLLLLPVCFFLIIGLYMTLHHELALGGLFAGMTVVLNYYRCK